jgi:hypothetical protein
MATPMKIQNPLGKSLDFGRFPNFRSDFRSRQFPELVGIPRHLGAFALAASMKQCTAFDIVC